MRPNSKCARRPLQELPNSKSASNRLAKNPEKVSAKGGDSAHGGGLLSVRSQISSILRQIDDLVVQANQYTGKHGRDKIKEFSDVLSNIEVSLKPWIPKFQSALKLDKITETSVACVVNDESDNIIESPKITQQKSLVSPSPLVSWRAEWNTEHGRQLFLLTPLPKDKGLSSKSNDASSLCLLEKISLDEDIQMVPAYDSLDRDKVSDSAVTNGLENLGINSSSPSKYQKMESSVLDLSPILKMSPPKSCVLLEPVSDSSRKANKAIYRSTPFPAKLQDSAESLDSESELTMKYSGLFGMKKGNTGNMNDLEQNSPNWILSPPKTCVIMEPPDEKSLGNVGESLLPKFPINDISTTEVVESTPMFKGSMMSSNYKGKHPGENTLKKELWTRFEEATPHAICFRNPVLQRTAQKGFLDRLDEASE